MKVFNANKLHLDENKIKLLFISRSTMLVFCCSPLIGFLALFMFGVPAQPSKMVLLLICLPGMLGLWVSGRVKPHKRQQISSNMEKLKIEEAAWINNKGEIYAGPVNKEWLNRRRSIQKPLLYPRHVRN